MPATNANNRHPWCRIVALTALVMFAFRAANKDEMPDLVNSVASASVAIECQKMSLVEDAETGISSLVPIRGYGSGVIVSEDGLIVTNRHVVADAISVVVTLYNGEKVAARVLESDASADLAVLKVRMRHLPFLRIGRAEDLRRGQRVVSLGNGHGLGRNGDLAVTAGVISGVRRNVDRIGIAPNGPWYEMDAPIYPGCSGGPVCDMSGRVVGINVAMSNFLKPFFIPLDAANRAVLSKISGGRV